MIYNITPLAKWREYEIKANVGDRTDIKLDIVKTSGDFASNKYIDSKV